MNRRIALILFLGFFGLFAACSEAEKNALDVQNIPLVLLSIFLQGVTFLAIFIYSFFAALHAMQHVKDPVDRTYWLIFTVVFNIMGAMFYYTTKYQAFRKIGKGGLIRNGHRRSLPDLIRLSKDEGNASN